MSSARANAAARQRRATPTANEAPPMQQNIRQPQMQRNTMQTQQMQRNPMQRNPMQAQQMQAQQMQAQQMQAQQMQAQQMQAQQMQQPVQNPPQLVTTKLSISDAIALITLRLGRVENIVQNIQDDPNITSDYSENKGTTGHFDESILVDLQKKVNIMENNQKNLENIVKNEIIKNGKQTTKSLPDAKMAEIMQKQKEFQKELVNLKDMLSKLQCFSMDLNQKLVNIVVTNGNVNGNENDNDNYEIEKQEEYEEQYQETEEEADEADEADDAEDSKLEFIPNLREFIKNELIVEE